MPRSDASLRALVESERRFHALALATWDLIWVTDHAGRMSGRLERWQTYTGQQPSELTGYGWLEAIHPEERAALRDLLEPASASASAFERELRIRAADGNYRSFAFKAVPVKSEDGSLLEWIGGANDLTERQQLERRFLQAQRLEAVGQLAGGIAHDFNNVLTSVLGFSQFLLDQLPSDSPYRSDAEEIYRAGELAAALTRKLLAFSRRQPANPQVLDLNQVIQDACQVLPRMLSDEIKLELDLRARPALVKADPGQLEQVMLNLAVNARDAMPQGGRLRIRTSATTLSEGLLHAGGMIPPGRYCVLSVADEGTGMPPEVLSRIFEPFFTTKGGTRGTGLGLSTVYGIVEQLGGHLVVQSAPGRGSSFELYLPMLEATATVMVQRPMGVALGDEVILVVEDLGAIRSLAQRTLSRAGYRVVTAESGEEARMAGRRAPRIDLIVMDVMLPGERGPAVARELKELHPAARIIYVSGNLGMREEDSSPDGQQWFLQKPFSPEQLLSIVRTALDAPVQSGVAPETPRT